MKLQDAMLWGYLGVVKLHCLRGCYRAAGCIPSHDLVESEAIHSMTGTESVISHE